ncbi:RNA polymerase sigma factor [Chitinophaga sp.]|uniref:RNA polymerase sigma factor n=1 Tax=Chitinophaga sp. TaxID=1869181 RepID=UPI002BB9D713|nr:RNA polymerase sigma factor [Chitinophaga sp.]HWV65375.1 RNA polymerase sigma factor [Chitinophaga sp.]
MNQSLYEKFLSSQSKLYRFAYSLAKNVSDAKDIHQDTLIKIWEMREQWEKWENMEAYGMRITRNTYLNFQKARQRRLHLELDELTEKPQPNEIEKHIVIDGLKHQFLSMIQPLPQLQQNILYLREVEELEYKEIAEILEISESQVKVYLFRGRQFIKTNTQK